MNHHDERMNQEQTVTVVAPPPAQGHNGKNGSNGTGHTVSPTQSTYPGEPTTTSIALGFVETPTSFWGRKENIAVEADEEFILSVAGAGRGEQVVAEYHNAKFDSAFADVIGSFQAKVAALVANIRSGEAHQQQLARERDAIKRVLSSPSTDAKPWTTWDRVEVVFRLVFAAVLLAVDVHSAALILSNSGLAGLHGSYVMSLFFNLGLVAGLALHFEGLSRHIEQDRSRQRYIYILYGLGFVAFAFAIPQFAQTYVGMSLSDPVVQLTSNQATSHANAWVSFWFQIITGNLAAGALMITAHHIYKSRWTSTPKENPVWRQMQDRLDVLTQKLGEEREMLGWFQGKLGIIEAKRKVLVDAAVERYHYEAQEIETARATLQKIKTIYRNPSDRN